MSHLKLDTLRVERGPRSPRRGSPSSGRNSACSSGSISPVPIIPIIAISHDGDESESESEIETEPARLFQRRMSTKCSNNLVSELNLLKVNYFQHALTFILIGK